MLLFLMPPPPPLLLLCPCSGEYVPDLGRTPMAAKDPTLLNAAQSAGYEMNPGDKPYDANQKQEKKGWFPWS
jgi:hypothetical protein